MFFEEIGEIVLGDLAIKVGIHDFKGVFERNLLVSEPKSDFFDHLLLPFPTIIVFLLGRHLNVLEDFFKSDIIEHFLLFAVEVVEKLLFKTLTSNHQLVYTLHKLLLVHKSVII